jgi:hypothetical protein
MMVYECEREVGGCAIVGRDLEEKRNEIGMVRNVFSFTFKFSSEFFFIFYFWQTFARKASSSTTTTTYAEQLPELGTEIV